jgi:sigma-B regulation protein RsbU (phosphoserine phosphatase)
VHGVNVSAKEVWGDLYDYFPLCDGRIYFCLADGSGKGMNAALLMAKTSSLFHCLGKAIHDPGRPLSTLNQEISETAVRGMFVTLVAGTCDPASGQVRLANAGYLHVLRVQRSGEVCEYPSNAVPLGILPGGEFPCTEFELKDASRYLFTDGLIEARTERGARLEMGALGADHRARASTGRVACPAPGGGGLSARRGRRRRPHPVTHLTTRMEPPFCAAAMSGILSGACGGPVAGGYNPALSPLPR